MPRGLTCPGLPYPLGTLSINKSDKNTLLCSRYACPRCTSQEKLAQYVLRRATKFQSCRGDICFVIGEKPSRKHFEKNNKYIYLQNCFVMISPYISGRSKFSHKNRPYTNQERTIEIGLHFGIQLSY